MPHTCMGNHMLLQYQCILAVALALHCLAGVVVLLAESYVHSLQSLIAIKMAYKPHARLE